MSVKNKVVVITGAASGLGLGMANEFAKQGAKVVIADLDLQKSQIVANGCYQSKPSKYSYR
jgi:3-hydroxybutyrate dehydrogenase